MPKRHTRPQNFNPRAPCGARRHASQAFVELSGFQPTRPLRGATFPFCRSEWQTTISTHAPLAGRDLTLPSTPSPPRYFNPRAPCGARLDRLIAADGGGHFNPRAPCGARPAMGSTVTLSFNFNPRAPCGARPSEKSPHKSDAHFNPRAPCGARPKATEKWLKDNAISTHAPLAGRDRHGLNRLK